MVDYNEQDFLNDAEQLEEPKQTLTPKLLDEHALSLFEKRYIIENQIEREKDARLFNKKDCEWGLTKRKTLFYLVCTGLILGFMYALIGTNYYADGTIRQSQCSDLLKFFIQAGIGGISGYYIGKKASI